MNSASKNVCTCFNEVWGFFLYFSFATVRVFDALTLHCCSLSAWFWHCLSCPRNAPVLISCFWAVVSFPGKGVNNAYCWVNTGASVVFHSNTLTWRWFQASESSLEGFGKLIHWEMSCWADVVRVLWCPCSLADVTSARGNN